MNLTSSASVYARLISALRSLTLNSTPLNVTGCFGSSSRIAAGAHAWQMPNHVTLQVPSVLPKRFAHTEPLAASHCASLVQGLPARLSMPLFAETASSTPALANARPYFSAADLLAAPAHRMLMLSCQVGQ